MNGVRLLGVILRIQEGDFALDNFASLDFTVGVTIHDSGLPIGFSLIEDEGSFDRKEYIVADGNSFSGQDGGNFVEEAVQGKGGILENLSGSLMKKHLIQIDGGIQGNDVFDFLHPCLKRRFPLQAPVRRPVVFCFQPGMEPDIQIFQALDGLGIQKS